MQLVFFTDSRFFRGKNGKIYNVSGGLPGALWQRYLKHFDRVVIVARLLENTSQEGIPAYEVPAFNVSVCGLPYYLGGRQYLRCLFKYRKTLRGVIEEFQEKDVAFLCRVPSLCGSLASKVLQKKKLSYGVEVGGDPWDVFASGGVDIPFRPFVRWWSTYNLKKCVRGADVALYVTRNVLQQRYPARRDAFCGSVSNVVLSEERIVSFPRTMRNRLEDLKIVSVGSLAQMYKSPDILLRALSIVKERGIRVQLNWAGDGKYLEDMKNLAKRLGVDDSVVWHGRLSAEKVDQLLLSSDIFVLASRTEGLPRALIEAMAKGLPCIGTKVGGIPELLDESVLVNANDAIGLAEKIVEMQERPNFTNEQAKRNLTEARKYEYSVLEEVRVQAFSFLKERSKK